MPCSRLSIWPWLRKIRPRCREQHTITIRHLNFHESILMHAYTHTLAYAERSQLYSIYISYGIVSLCTTAAQQCVCVCSWRVCMACVRHTYYITECARGMSEMQAVVDRIYDYMCSEFRIFLCVLCCGHVHKRACGYCNMVQVVFSQKSKTACVRETA